MFDLSSAVSQIIFIGGIILIGWVVFSFVKRKKK